MFSVKLKWSASFFSSIGDVRLILPQYPYFVGKFPMYKINWQVEFTVSVWQAQHTFFSKPVIIIQGVSKSKSEQVSKFRGGDRGKKQKMGLSKTE